MTTYRHKHLSTDAIEQRAEDFGITDEKGRKVGVKTVIYLIKTRLFEEGDGAAWLHPFPDTTHYSSYVQPTRNGQNFGASQHGKSSLTLDHARTEINRRVRGTRARYQKKYALAASSFKAEVIADSSGEWTGNALRFSTRAKAESYVADLAMRWTSVRETRVVESGDPVYEGRRG